MKLSSFATLGSVLGIYFSASVLAVANPVKRDIAGTATVFLDQPSGKPEKLASGWIYGFPDNADGTANTDIPQKYIKDVGFNYNRAGGAQTPYKGWARNEYEGRWKSSLSNYRTTRRNGGKFILLIHDLWGADSTQGKGFPYPGDGGNWKNWNAFLDQVFSDILKNKMTAGLEIDIWNEPDLNLFWDAPQTQYLNMWKRTYERIRKELPGVQITGPSTTTPPTVDSEWYNNYLKFIAKTNTIPDFYSWHLLATDRNLRESKAQFDTLRKKYKLPERPININEYASWDGEQNPAGAVFYISQFERHNAHGLRANWASQGQLHDFLANLLVKNSGGDYSPAGEWHVYQYYNQAMKGNRVATSPSDDELFEVYATRGGSAGTVKILAAIRPVAGKKTYNLAITGLSAVKVKGSTVRVRTYRFDGPNVSTAVGAPVDLGTFKHTIKNDQIMFFVAADDRTQAFAFEFEV
ncbi:glycoside hydrolase family 39 [Fusarium pseudocircinatum]|uniref:Glycoside hydrolase family 39 n=1 Tax=Fusarium pseudocircinatum TaxID=56676 RepID=A0A8H5P1L2_9HYPO|nr:glycoside hydrolase family 39 [Fusarium pseudocircinatum]